MKINNRKNGLNSDAILTQFHGALGSIFPFALKKNNSYLEMASFLPDRCIFGYFQLYF